MKDQKIYLSWTLLNGVHKNPCFYVNYTLFKLKQPENEFIKAGKSAHERFALMIKNKKKLPLELDFQKAEVHFRRPYNSRYTFHTFCDAVNYKSRSILELKTVNKNLWTNAKMDQTMQPLYISWVSNFRNVFLLTTKFDLSEPKLFFRQYTDRDWERAKKWAMEGYKIIEETDWKKLTCSGDCSYGTDCRIFQKDI